MLYYVLFGLILIAAGLLLRFAPIRKNYFFGYRSFQSMKTIESWKYANVTFGKFGIVIGCVSLLFGAVCYFFGVFDYKVVVIGNQCGSGIVSHLY